MLLFPAAAGPYSALYGPATAFRGCWAARAVFGGMALIAVDVLGAALLFLASSIASLPACLNAGGSDGLSSNLRS